MSRLPRALQPAWPAVKRVHRLGTLLFGILTRRLAPLYGERGLPRGSETSASTTVNESAHVRLHRAVAGERLHRAQAVGRPSGHWVFERARDFVVPDPFVLEIDSGIVVGDYGANITPDGVLDFETSEYFGITGWREHPLYLRTRLPAPEQVDGTLVSLAARGGSNNYYHFLLDVLPRWGIVRQTLPDLTVDALYVPAGTPYQKQLLAMAGLDRLRIVETGKHRAAQAGRLVVPSLPNPDEIAPMAVTDWVRAQFPPVRLEGRPRRLFVTRGQQRNTRRLHEEATIWPMLEQRGFVRIDPGAMPVQEQIDHFAAAETIVGVHGAALTNLVFGRPGVRVLELFAPGYVKHCYWAITDNIADSRYRYLIGDGRGPRVGGRMNRIQADIALDAARVEAALDQLLDG